MTHPVEGAPLGLGLPFLPALLDDLSQHGYSVQKNVLPDNLLQALLHDLQSPIPQDFKPAGIGRGDVFTQDKKIRSDEIAWITGQSLAEKNWLALMEQVQLEINRNLFLGLQSFECHFARYKTGSFYKTHKDAFKGQSNRLVSMVLYLNKDWEDGDGGELVLYHDDDPDFKVILKPEYGTMTLFLSEEFPHEVLPARKERFSIAGWFRIHQSPLPGITVNDTPVTA